MSISVEHKSYDISNELNTNIDQNIINIFKFKVGKKILNSGCYQCILALFQHGKPQQKHHQVVWTMSYKKITNCITWGNEKEYLVTDIDHVYKKYGWVSMNFKNIGEHHFDNTDQGKSMFKICGEQ